MCIEDGGHLRILKKNIPSTPGKCSNFFWEETDLLAPSTDRTSPTEDTLPVHPTVPPLAFVHAAVRAVQVEAAAVELVGPELAGVHAAIREGQPAWGGTGQGRLEGGGGGVGHPRPVIGKCRGICTITGRGNHRTNGGARPWVAGGGGAGPRPIEGKLSDTEQKAWQDGSTWRVPALDWALGLKRSNIDEGVDSITRMSI